MRLVNIFIATLCFTMAFDGYILAILRMVGDDANKWMALLYSVAGSAALACGAQGMVAQQ